LTSKERALLKSVCRDKDSGEIGTLSLTSTSKLIFVPMDEARSRHDYPLSSVSNISVEKDGRMLVVELQKGQLHQYAYAGGDEVWGVSGLDAEEWQSKIMEIKERIVDDVTKKKIVTVLKSQETTSFDELRTLITRETGYEQANDTSVIPETFDFQSRTTRKHQYNASDPVNLALNYAYGVLEGECRRAINTVGLEPSIGFLHDFADYQTKQSLVYDIQEPYRWLADISVIEAFESGLLDMKDFYFMGDDYRYHFEVEAKRRFLELLRNRFSSGVQYKCKFWPWDTIILNKVQELGRFLLGKTNLLNLVQPSPEPTRADGLAMRERILELTQKQAKERHITKSTLHYLLKRATDERPFKIYRKVRNMLE